MRGWEHLQRPHSMSEVNVFFYLPRYIRGERQDIIYPPGEPLDDRGNSAGVLDDFVLQVVPITTQVN